MPWSFGVSSLCWRFGTFNLNWPLLVRAASIPAPEGPEISGYEQPEAPGPAGRTGLKSEPLACETDGLGGEGCTRMRPKLHLRLPVLGHAFRLGVTGVMA